MGFAPPNSAPPVQRARLQNRIILPLIPPMAQSAGVIAAVWPGPWSLLGESRFTSAPFAFVARAAAHLRRRHCASPFISCLHAEWKEKRCALHAGMLGVGVRLSFLLFFVLLPAANAQAAIHPDFVLPELSHEPISAAEAARLGLALRTFVPEAGEGEEM